MITHALGLATLLSTALLVGNEFSVGALVHPALVRAGHRENLPALQALAARLGRVMPFWMAGTLAAHLFLWGLAPRSPYASLIGGAAALWAAVILFSVLWEVPINNRVQRWRPDALPSDWAAQRRRWDRLHALRVAAMVVAFVLLAMGGASFC